MLYSSFTSNPRFTKYLVEKGVLKNNPLVIVDVGARGGLEYHWANYGDMIQFIGFEPEAEECNKLNDSISFESKSKFYPVALFKDKGTYLFNQAVSPAASGLYSRDEKLVNRFPVGELVKILKTTYINTTDFDSFATEYNIPAVDFLKTDAEGADYDIVKGAVNQLKSVIGLSCEIHFAPWCGKGFFSELEQLLRPLGFRLYDINLFRFANKAFLSVDSVLPGGCGAADYGQIIFGQAIFFRDAVAEIEDKKLISKWDEIRILKAVSLFEVFQLPDCAIELLNTAFKHKILSDIDKYRDLITSGFLGKTTTYEKHLQRLARIKKRGYLNCYEFLKPYFKKIPYLADIRRFIKKQIAYRQNNYG